MMMMIYHEHEDDVALKEMGTNQAVHKIRLLHPQFSSLRYWHRCNCNVTNICSCSLPIILTTLVVKRLHVYNPFIIAYKTTLPGGKKLSCSAIH